MRVRIIQAFAEGFRVHNRGDEFDTTTEYGVTLLRRGVAEKLEQAVETTEALPRGERAMRVARPLR